MSAPTVHSTRPAAGAPAGSDERSRLAHLYRRAGFGATEAQLDAAEARGYEATVDELLTASDPTADAIPPPALTPPGGEPLPGDVLRQEIQALVIWWLRRMVASEVPLREKLPFFWHGLLTSSVEKVRWPSLMLDQNQLFRDRGLGDFEGLLQAVTIDPAMLIWLDGLGSHRSSPNENYAREVMELFALGRGNYTETDVREAARALTGYRVDRSGPAIVFDPSRWDPGSKTVLGRTGDWDTQDVIGIICEHAACAPWIASRVWSYFAFPVDPDHPVAQELGTVFAAADLDVAELLRRVFLHPEFDSVEAREGLVKTPVEWLVGTLRRLNLDPDASSAAALPALQQVPFAPPHVAGWAQNGYWVNTASELARVRLSLRAAIAGDTTSVHLADEADRPTAAAALLGVDAWSERTETALANAASSPDIVVALALGAPEYVVN